MKTAELPNIEKHIVHYRAYPGGRPTPESVHLCFDDEDEMHEWLEAYHQQMLEEVKDDVAEKLQDLFGLIDDHKGGYWINGNAQKKIGDFLVWYASLTQEK